MYNADTYNADTSADDCPVSIWHTEVMSGRQIHTSQCHPDVPSVPTRPIAVIRCTECSDYSGTAVRRSNYRVLLDDGNRHGLIQIYGAHGYRALAFDASLGPVPDSEELRELLEAAAEHGVIDDSDCDDLEREMEYEAWSDHGLADFRMALTYLLDEIDPGAMHPLPDDCLFCTDIVLNDMLSRIDVAKYGDLLRALWEEGCDEFAVNGGNGYMIEAGGRVHFDIDTWMKRAREMQRPIPSHKHSGLPRILAKLAEVSRSIDK
jgi:hypothetical protein